MDPAASSAFCPFHLLKSFVIGTILILRDLCRIVRVDTQNRAVKLICRHVIKLQCQDLTCPGGFYGPEVNDRRKRLERLKTSTENELDTLREYGVTRCMENRIETYAARTEQEIRSMIRLKERELALVNNEIWHAHDKGLGKDTIAWFLDARSRLYGELRALRTEKKDIETRDQNREFQPQAPQAKTRGKTGQSRSYTAITAAIPGAAGVYIRAGNGSMMFMLIVRIYEWF